MDNQELNTTEVQEESKFSWTGFAVGFVGGAVLFLITIYVVKALMFSRTAA